MQLPVQNVGIIADDLTGACDTALQFFSPVMETHILVELPEKAGIATAMSEPNRHPYHALAINTGTRHCTPHEAEAFARQAMALCRDRYNVDHTYKKIDSTLRGHIAHECLGIMEEMKAQCAIIVPAYPGEGRRTVGGYQLLRGIPVEKTIVARDPLFPVRQSHVPTLLSMATRPELVGHIALSDVLHGAGPILVRLKELIGEGRKLIVVDATSNEDLEQIALAIEKARKYASILPCGSAGLAHALANIWAVDDDTDLPDVNPDKTISSPSAPVLMVAGSNTDTTRQQLRKLVEHYSSYGQDSELTVFELPPETILGLVPYEELIAKIRAALGTRNTVVLAPAARDDSYRRTLAIANEHGITDAQASHLVQDTLARMTLELSQAQPFKLVVAGGETTASICELLNIHTLKILSEVEASIPIMEDETGRWIVTKSGGFGSPMILANIIRFIKQRETLPMHSS